MIIPFEQIADETLTAIIEEFIVREGGDNGDIDINNDQKITQVKQQLKQGSVVVVYSELYESVNILPKAQFMQQLAESEHDEFTHQNNDEFK
ncbi:YheU family protein [Colwellia sp. D2M02]|uniref:YheU family protein n=1 Tax=Colwellia asteriadis TaxID=517723 RepID=A0ABN1LAF7_9GAMM|nr:YheU family protein [Colwellia sp. D2M02]MBU2893285.1 YheU family protein [Colwellia sp. D2M02]